VEKNMKNCLFAYLAIILSHCFGGLFGAPLLSGKSESAEIFKDPVQIDLINAIEARNFVRVDAVLEKMPIDKPGASGETILWWLANVGDFEGFRYLMSKGANPLRQIKDGPNIMELCAMQANGSFIREIMAFGGNLNMIGQFTKEMPIFAAISQRRYSNVEFMLNSGAYCDVADATGTTPALLAADEKAYDILIILLKHGANPKTKNSQKYDVVRSLNERHPASDANEFTMYMEAYRMANGQATIDEPQVNQDAGGIHVPKKK
jgi:ankyrin repeat protein